MLNVVKEKLELSPDLRKKINWAVNTLPHLLLSRKVL